MVPGALKVQKWFLKADGLLKARLLKTDRNLQREIETPRQGKTSTAKA